MTAKLAAAANAAAPVAKLAASALAPKPAPTVMALAAVTPEPVVAESAPIPMPPKRPIYQVASADSRSVPAAAPRQTAPINVASLSPNEIINMRGLWDGVQQAADASSSDAANMSNARRALAASLTANRDVTAALKPFADADRVPVETALAYAAPAANDRTVGRAPEVTPAVVTTKGGASIAEKPVGVTGGRFSRSVDKFDDPWLRGVMLTSSVQNSLVVVRVGDVDVMGLTQHMQKPASAVMMTFSADPNLGMTTESFTGSAVVFQATVTFNPASRRTAALR